MRKFLIAAVIATVSGSAFAQSTAEPMRLATVVNFLPVMASVPGLQQPVPRVSGVGLNNVPLGGGLGGGGLLGMSPGLTTLVGVAIVGGIYAAQRDKTCTRTASGNC